MRFDLWRIILISCSILAGRVVVFGSDCSVNKQVEQSCQACHPEIAESINTTPHRILIAQDGKRVKNSPCGCTDCHRFFTGHPEKTGSIENPARLEAERNYELCSQCHIDPHIQEYSKFNVHLRNNISCSGCHKLHTPKAQHLLSESPEKLCLNCHRNVKAQFLEVSHHPVLEKVISCIDCHQVLKDFEGILSEGDANERCYFCHSEFSGPFPFEHEAAVDYSIQEGSCSSCHLPHGSSNPRLLKEPGNNLCLQCHLVPKHKMPHPGIVQTDDYTEHNCMECHVDIHGSYQSEYFFDFQALDFRCSSCHCR
jgi:DmsE family decaheme c-type cytochrome